MTMQLSQTYSSDDESQSLTSRSSESDEWQQSSISGSSTQSNFINNAKQQSAIRSGHLSNEYNRLKEHLEHADPKSITQNLLNKLFAKSSKHIVALGILLPRTDTPTPSRLHCVRCHRVYRPDDKITCCLRHPTPHVRKIYQDVDGADFMCSVCGTDFRLNRMFFYEESVNGYYAGLCFTGQHTADPRDVTYDALVKTCEENGCVEFYV